MKDLETSGQLLKLLEEGVSSFHTIQASVKRLAQSGFQRLHLRDKWELWKILCSLSWNNIICLYGCRRVCSRRRISDGSGTWRFSRISDQTVPGYA